MTMSDDDLPEEDTKRVHRGSVSRTRRASSVFPSPDKAHAEVDALDGDWREREAVLRRENERLRNERNTAVAERDSYRDAVRTMQDLVEKRDREIRILKKALGR